MSFCRSVEIRTDCQRGFAQRHPDHPTRSLSSARTSILPLDIVVFFALRGEHGHTVGELVAFGADVGGDVGQVPGLDLHNLTSFGNRWSWELSRGIGTASLTLLAFRSRVSTA